MASKLPIDISAVLKEATDIDAAAHTPISVSVYIDETAPGDCAALVRSAFASEAGNVRLSVGYVGEGAADAAGAFAAVRPDDDMAVVVAGVGEWVGPAAARLRAAGVPAMVVSTMGPLVDDLARAVGSPVPDGDLLSPVALAGDEPVELDEAARALLLARMGTWVIATCKSKRLAFALAFDFVRRPLASEIIRANSVQNAGIGAVMFIPGADMPLMTLNQMRMLLQIAAAYGKPMDIQRAKELAVVVGGAFACRAAARQLAGLVPGLGWAAKAGVAYAGTEAMGRAAIEYFEAGGDAAGLAGLVAKLGETAGGVAEKATSAPVAQKAATVARDAAWAAYDALGKFRR